MTGSLDGVQVSAPDDLAGPSPWRRVRLDRARALFEFLCSLDGVTAPEARAMSFAVVESLARDRERFSDVLEASLSKAETGEHALRFSYAFPGFREAPAIAIQAALSAFSPFGSRVTAIAKRLLRAALDPAVEQPLIGVAWDHQRGGPRHKMYLQLKNTAKQAGTELVMRVLDLPWLGAALESAHLHMLGIDFDDSGLLGAKLYVAHANVDLTAPCSPSMEAAKATLCGLFDEPRTLRNVLAIFRIGPSDRAARALPPPSDVDFGLIENSLEWSRLAQSSALLPFTGDFHKLRAVSSAFRIGARRISLGLGKHRRLTVYYALREVEEP